MREAYFIICATLSTQLQPALANGCCLKKLVNTGTGDARDGTYNFNKTLESLPVFCGDICVYSKENDADPNNLYCFGTGDIDSVCTAEGSPGPEAPTGAPVAGGQNKNSEESVPSGEYYFNKLPGTVTRAVLCGETISIVTEGRLAKLDLATQGSLVTADSSSWSATKLRFVRIDGASAGDVQFDHLVAVFAKNSAGVDYRLKISGEDPPSTDTTTSKLKVMSGDGAACSGSVQYETEYGVFTSDELNRLDIGDSTFWDENSAATRFHLNPEP